MGSMYKLVVSSWWEMVLKRRVHDIPILEALDSGLVEMEMDKTIGYIEKMGLDDVRHMDKFEKEVFIQKYTGVIETLNKVLLENRSAFWDLSSVEFLYSAVQRLAQSDTDKDIVYAYEYIMKSLRILYSLSRDMDVFSDKLAFSIRVSMFYRDLKQCKESIAFFSRRATDHLEKLRHPRIQKNTFLKTDRLPSELSRKIVSKVDNHQYDWGQQHGWGMWKMVYDEKLILASKKNQKLGNLIRRLSVMPLEKTLQRRASTGRFDKTAKYGALYDFSQGILCAECHAMLLGDEVPYV